MATSEVEMGTRVADRNSDGVWGDARLQNGRTDHKAPALSQYLARIESLVDKVEDWSRLPDDPLVSVYMITFNHESFIRQALDSVLMQDVSFPYEIVIGEDKSTDRTREIVCEYQQQHPDKIRLRLARENLYSRQLKPGIGVLHACRGKYIALLEGDDYWTDSLKLQKQVEVLEEHPDFSMCSHNTLRIYDGQRQESCTAILHPKPILELTDFLDIDLFQERNNLCLPAHTSSYLIRASALPSSVPEWFLNAVSVDLCLFAMVAGQGNCFFIEETMSVRRKHAGSITSHEGRANRAFANWIQIFKGLDEYYGYRYHALIARKIMQLLRKLAQLNVKDRGVLATWRFLRSTAPWSKRSSAAKLLLLIPVMVAQEAVNIRRHRRSCKMGQGTS